MSTLRLTESSLTDEIVALRKLSAAAPQHKDPDWINPKSCQICLFSENDLAAIVRYTAHCPSVVKQWSPTSEFIREELGFVDITKGVVAPAFRGLGFFRLLMAFAANHARQAGWKSMQGIVSNHALLGVWEELGAEMIGERNHLYESHPKGPTPAQGICLPLEANLQLGVSLTSTIEKVSRELGNGTIIIE